MSRKQIKVNFNLEDEYEVRLMDHALRQGKFSKYVKRIIGRDMEGTVQNISSPSVQEVRKLETDSFF